MSKIVPLSFTPDLDTAWTVAPGAVRTLANLAPLARGSFGTVGRAAYIGAAGGITSSGGVTDIKFGQMFRKIDGSVRLLVFRTQNIDEYNSSATKTNQGTGYSASTDDWSAAGFGNAIIACNYLDATQVSTGTTFGALGGSSPKARLVAANSNFVMLADYDDPSGTYGDGWWCSAVGNYASFAPNAATQAANGRILECGGPIVALVAYKDGFIAFKADSMHQMDYIGPPLVWSVRTISNHIGCVGKHAVCEFGGKLWFMHTSGIYSFDGANLSDVGAPVINSLLADFAFKSSDQTTLAARPLSEVQAVADDIENVVWFGSHCAVAGGNSYWYNLNYGLNVSTGKWGTWYLGYDDLESVYKSRYVFARTSEVQAFKASTSARILSLTYVNGTTSTLHYIGYPLAGTGNARIVTGMVGSTDGSARTRRMAFRLLAGTDASPLYQHVAYGYACESKQVAYSAVTGTWNATFEAVDFQESARFREYLIDFAASKRVEIAGIGIDSIPSGVR